MPAVGVQREAAVLPHDGEQRAHRQRDHRRQLDVGCRKPERPRHADFVRRRRSWRPQRVRRQIADIAVAFELAPGPAFVARLIDGDAFDQQRLRDERRFVSRLAPHIDDRLHHFAWPAVDELSCLDSAFETLCRDVAAERIDAGIERGHLKNSAWKVSHRGRARFDIRRLRGGRAWRRSSRRKYRDAARIWR